MPDAVGVFFVVFSLVTLPGRGLQSWLGGLRSPPAIALFSEDGELAVTFFSLAGLLGQTALGAKQKKRAGRTGPFFRL